MSGFETEMKKAYHAKLHRNNIAILHLKSYKAELSENVFAPILIIVAPITVIL